MNKRILPLHFFFILGWVTFCWVASAQTPGLNAEKYQVYRTRLLNQFMVVSPGNEPGTGIPASIRHAGRNQMRWGDATINLSNYMAVLATEYRRLKDEGADVGQTLSELHLALLTKERLDANAPAFFDPNGPAMVPDGFFIRDDVPAGFTQQWAWKNPAFHDYPEISSDYTKPNLRDNEMSQDQVWNLIVGLSLIARLVDDTTTWLVPAYYGLQPYTLAERARLAGYRIISMLQDEAGIDLFGKRVAVPYWHLRNPYTGKTVLRGAGPGLLKYGFAEAGNVITAGSGMGNLHWANSENARIWFNLSAAFQYLQRLRGKGNIENLYHSATTATVGHVWSTSRLIRMFNRHRHRNTGDNRQYEHLALISCLLHNDCPALLAEEKDWYVYLLNSAPWHGPFNYGQPFPSTSSEMDTVMSVHNGPGLSRQGNYLVNQAGNGFLPGAVTASEGSQYAYRHEYHHEWSSVNRFVWPERRGEGTPEWLQGEYNGLDYLLLYNLYHLVYGNR